MDTGSRSQVKYHNGNEKEAHPIQKDTTVSTKGLLAGSGTNYLIFTAFFLLVYFKLLSRRKKGAGLKLDVGDEKIYGLSDIQAVKPFLPINLVGNIPNFLPVKDVLKKALQWDREYPGLAKVTGLNQVFIGLNSGPLVQQLFKSTDFGHNVKSPVIYSNMKPYITNGVLVSTGKFWQGQRKILMKSQSFLSLKAYMGMLNKHSKAFVEELEILFEDGKPHEINGQINIVFLRVVSEMLTGYDANSSSEFDRYHHNFTIWKESIVKRILNPWLLLNPLWKLHPMSRKNDKAVEEMFDFARRRIKEHREKRLVTAKRLETDNCMPQIKDKNKPHFRSVLDELVDAGVDENQIVDEVNTMIFGGHETGATTIHFFCFAIALNPEIQEKCREEVDELFQNTLLYRNGLITHEAAQGDLKYVERCILETLRLFPPVFMFLRQLKTPLKVIHENKAYLLPVGTNIGTLPFLLHRNPDYFPEPDRFDPDRFLKEEVEKRHPYSFIPFSGGSRNCLGLKFAMLEMKVIVAYLLRNFVISTTDKMEDIPLLPYTTLTPAKDFTFRFQKRNVQN